MNTLPLRARLFIFLQHCIPQHLLTTLAGRLASSETPLIKNLLIRSFTAAFDIDMEEALESEPTNYRSFNAFFTRALKPDLRPIETNTVSIVSPADGSISQAGKITDGKIFQAKGKYFSLKTLLGGDEDTCRQFFNGCFATVYLSPRDYHRVHMPCNGKLIKTSYIPGKLFSVNEATANGVEGLFARNERLVCFFQTEQGPMAMVLVGAMIVAGIETVWKDFSEKPYNAITSENISPALELNKGDEMGRFKLGSTVILLFGDDAVAWDKKLDNGTPVQMGRPLGTAN